VSLRMFSLEEKALMVRWKAFARRHRVVANGCTSRGRAEAFSRIHAPFIGLVPHPADVLLYVPHQAVQLRPRSGETITTCLPSWRGRGHTTVV